DRQPNGALVRFDIVRQPGVAGPGPPERAEHEQRTPEPGPGRIDREHARHLRDREDEDEVEEELERSYPLLALGSRHERKLSIAQCTTSTSHGAWRTSLVLTEPSIRRRSPLPRPTTTMPAPDSSAAARISVAGSPTAFT